jgi:hypothetical protein
MNAEAILARLQSVRRNRAGWAARCPAHDDKTPSLSVRAENGRILLHCFRGCSINAICEGLSIKLSDLFTEPQAVHKLEPCIVREVQSQMSDLRSRLTPRDRVRAVTVVLANIADLEAAMARALALAVEGELCQVASRRDSHERSTS